MSQKLTGERVKPTSKEFYYIEEWNNEDYWVQADKAKRVRIPGLEEFDLFTHRITFVTGMGGTTRVSEGTTGIRVDRYADSTREKTLEHFRQYATEPEFIANLRELIQTAKAKGYVSPRYEEVEKA